MTPALIYGKIKHMKYYLGVDIGASKIGFALISDEKFLKFKKIATPRRKKEFIKEIKENIKLIGGEKKLSGLGIGLAGMLNAKKSKIILSSNLKIIQNLPLASILSSTFKIPIKMENDAKCFALAEAIMGAGKDKKIVLGLTLGSGIGGGLVSRLLTDPSPKPHNVTSWQKGRQVQRESGSHRLPTIWQGAYGAGHEVGHMTINSNGYKCDCGNIGCWETYCSQKFFLRLKIDPKILAQRAELCDKKALKIFQEYGQNLGIGLANLANILEPEVIVIGGGLANTWPHFLTTARREAKKRIVCPIAKEKLRIKITRLGDKSGAIGAAIMISKQTMK